MAATPIRASLYNEELADEICSRLETGESLYRICKDSRFPSEAAVRRWAMVDYCGFAAKYTRARDLGLDAMADQVLELAASARDPLDVPRARLEFDAARWYLSKLAPKRYGDAMQLRHADANGNALEVQVTRVSPRPPKVIDVTPRPALTARPAADARDGVPEGTASEGAD